jgi:type I restriction-modification system DNA methylase subunit
LGRVYEYFLAQFASAEGKKGGQFYTPAHVVRVLVAMLAPYKGRVYDPCCGSGGMFVQSEKFIEAHAGKIGDISIYGQESNYTTWRLAKMNLALRGIDAQIAHGDTFHNDKHPDLKADYVLANPPFNDSDWRGELLKDDKRWVYGVPPAGNANYAWVQHFIYHLAPNGIAGFVLANGSMSTNQSGEGEIRKAIIEADLVDCMVALPGQLFFSTQIPVCLWFIARDKRGQPSPATPLPRGEGHYRGGFDFSGQLELARELRQRATPAEAFAWELLRDRRFLGLKFRRQHQIGDYVVDFYCDEQKLVVELDGAVHDPSERQQVDHKRDGYLKALGLAVLRVPNERLFEQTEETLKEIAQAITPSPAGRGGDGEPAQPRDRHGEVLFIDARKMGRLVDRTHLELTEEDAAKIANTYHLWRGDPHPGPLPEGEGVQYRGGFEFSGLAARARELRQAQTPAEEVMWELLRDRRFLGLKLRRQHQIGEYIVDFYCDEHRLVVELDGSVHDEAAQAKKDAMRDAYLRSLGLAVLRFPNESFLTDPKAILNEIGRSLTSPLGRGGGEGASEVLRSSPLSGRGGGEDASEVLRSSSPLGRGGGEGDIYEDVLGFCKATTTEEIRKHGYVLTPGRYVGAEEAEDDLPAPRPGCFFVYAIRCDDDSIYIGHTDNLQRRWNEHCAGQGADWTKRRKPVRIVHYEEYGSREEAVAREKELKTTSGRRWLKEEIAAGRARQAGGEPFDEKMKRLTATLREQQAEAAKLDEAIAKNLRELGYGG